MQTLHLRFRDLRAISPGQSPGRWQTPSMRARIDMEGRAAPSKPSQANLGGWIASRQADRASVPTDAPRRGPVCRWRLRSGRHMASDLTVPPCAGFAPGKPPVRRPMIPPPTRLGIMWSAHWQARASEILRTPSVGLSFPLRPQRCGARASGEKTADPVANVGASAGVSSGARRRRSSSAGG